jgi:hypothetical protein
VGTLQTYGRSIPTTGDRDFWTQLEDNITLDDAHSHDGVDSAQLSPKNFSKSTASILAAAWAAVSGQSGTYSQTVTVPTGYAVNSMQVKFYITSGGQAGYEVFPTVRKASATTYELFTNDNTLGYTAVYG